MELSGSYKEERLRSYPKKQPSKRVRSADEKKKKTPRESSQVSRVAGLYKKSPSAWHRRGVLGTGMEENLIMQEPPNYLS